MNFIAEEQNCFVVYPAQRNDANHAKCWNWFRTADQQRGDGEPSLIAGITRQVMHDYSVDPAARLCWRAVGRSGGGCRHGGNIQRSLRSDRCAFWSRLRRRHRSSIGVCGHATRRRTGRQCHSRRPDICPDNRFSRRSRHDGASGQRSSGCLSSPRKLRAHKGRCIAGRSPEGMRYTRTIHTDTSGRAILEHWNIHGAGHAWSGGSPAGSYTIRADRTQRRKCCASSLSTALTCPLDVTRLSHQHARLRVRETPGSPCAL